MNVKDKNLEGLKGDMWVAVITPTGSKAVGKVDKNLSNVKVITEEGNSQIFYVNEILDWCEVDPNWEEASLE